jgi:DNA-binding MarR family transcriptional regulator
MSTDLIQAIVRLRRSLTRAATAAFASTGVGPRQLGVLRELRHAGPVAQVELARSTATDPAGLMRAIDALEARGWVQRTGSEHDRRCKLVSLTPQGQRALQGLDVTYAPLRSLAEEALTPAERRQFITLAEKLTTAIDAAGHAPTLPTPARAGKRRAEHR